MASTDSRKFVWRRRCVGTGCDYGLVSSVGVGARGLIRPIDEIMGLFSFSLINFAIESPHGLLEVQFVAIHLTNN